MNRKPKLFKDQKKNAAKKKTILSPRSPLQHLNGATGSISGSTSSSRDGFISSSSSSSSRTVRKPQMLFTPASKSVHNSKTARPALSCFRSNKSVKVNRLNTNPLKNKLNPTIASKKKKILREVKTTVEQTCTPAGNNKVVRIDEEDDSTSKTKNTPPIQISVSPEIQGGLSISVNAAAATPSCYCAGHLLSGVTDRRKCRPRGILAVGENNADLHEFSTSSLFMRPLEASMRWLFNNGDQNHIPSMFSISSPSSCEVITLLEKMKNPYDDLDKGNNWSPFSIDSLCSDNVIKTPESDSIFNHYPEIQSFEVPLRENLSPENSIGNQCSIDCSSMKELFGSKLSLSLKDGINEIEEEPNSCRYLSDNEKDGIYQFDFPESFAFGVINGEETIPQQHKASILAESLTIDGDSISDMFSRSSNHS